MKETESILLTHLERYPEMQPQDCVKLLYQNEFGCEHFVSDAESALEWMKREYDSVRHDEGHILIEDIGNGFVRVHLEPLESSGISIEALCKAFIESANASKQGSVEKKKERFIEKISLLDRICTEGGASFSHEQLEKFLDQYRSLGYPPVHHSEVFREKYHPAYRVISASHIKALLDRI